MRRAFAGAPSWMGRREAPYKSVCGANSLAEPEFSSGEQEKSGVPDAAHNGNKKQTYISFRY